MTLDQIRKLCEAARPGYFGLNHIQRLRYIDACRALMPKLLAVAEAAAQIPKSPSPVHRHILTPGFGDLAAALAALEAEP